MKKGSYFSVLLMAVLMVVIGYATMTAALESNKTFHLNKLYAAFLMAALGVLAEIVIMRWPFGKSEAIASAVLLGISFWLVIAMRRQYFVGRSQFLKGMIEHHAMALVMAKRAAERRDIAPDESTLAKNILRTQACEIGKMRQMLQATISPQELQCA